jgi:hypothetical protein
VLSLVNFDVKGAYNRVAKEVLIQRLESRRMPQDLVRWIGDFCANRQASIVVNGSPTGRPASGVTITPNIILIL